MNAIRGAPRPDPTAQHWRVAGVGGRPTAPRAGWYPAFPPYPWRPEMKYEKPVVTRFGSLRELTLGGGPMTSGDATNLYHRS